MKIDDLDRNIKEIMEKDSKDIRLSDERINNILGFRRKRLLDRFREWANKEIEMPIITVIGLVGIGIIILGSPLELIINTKDVKVIDIGISHLIIKERNGEGYYED